MDNNYTYKKKSELSDVHRFNRLYQAVEQFEYSSELAKRVYHLGNPCFTDSVHTASLSITQNGNRSFNFNRSFFDKLGANEMIFVIFHEALHYTFRHLFRRLDRLPALWNIACDLVVNNFLLEKVGFSDISNPRFRNFLKSAITFENLPISPVSQRLSLTAEEVYELLVRNQKTVQKNSSDLHACDDHDWSDDRVQNETKEGMMDDDSGEPTQSNNDYEVEGNETIEDLVEQSQKIFREWMPNWGDTPLGELRAIGEITKSIDISWDLILSKRIASCIKLAFEERWAPPNRKIAWLYPDILLPADQEVEQPLVSILMAIDASGSISQSVLNKLVAIARSIPKNQVQLTVVSFDTRIYPVDILAQVPKILEVEEHHSMLSQNSQNRWTNFQA
jgi:predicted metal-dependent peptidase